MCTAAAVAVALLGLFAQARPEIRVEAEAGQLAGVEIAGERVGHSGSGYVTGLDAPGDSITLTARAAAGIYHLRLRYAAPHGDKGFALRVNGSALTGLLRGTGQAFATHRAGKVELKQGANTIKVERGWGYFDLDYVELLRAGQPRPLHKLPAKPVNARATPQARALLRYLAGLYGSRTLSGQYDRSEVQYVQSVAGQTPAVFGGDLMDYSASRTVRGSRPGDTMERLVEAARAGHILTISWHWNAPSGLIDKETRDAQGNKVDARWYRGFYTHATTFDLQKALANPRSNDYRLLLFDIDNISRQLRKAADAGVPVLWRPLHEAEGKWFWWGARGPEPFKRLWRLMYDRMTRRHGLHNLLWVWTGTDQAWYPGDGYVDVVGVDAYPEDATDVLSGTWDDLLSRFDGRKLLALTEFGGVPDIDRMRRFGVRWSYFVSWTGDGGPRKIDRQAVKRFYSSRHVLNRRGLKRTW